MLRFRFYRPFRPRCQVRGPQHLVVLSSHFHYILHKRFTSIRSRLNGFPTAYPLCFHVLPTAFPQRFPHRFPQAFPSVFTTFARRSPPAGPQSPHSFSATARQAPTSPEIHGIGTRSRVVQKGATRVVFDFHSNGPDVRQHRPPPAAHRLLPLISAPKTTTLPHRETLR